MSLRYATLPDLGVFTSETLAQLAVNNHFASTVPGFMFSLHYMRGNEIIYYPVSDTHPFGDLSKEIACTQSASTEHGGM